MTGIKVYPRRFWVMMIVFWALAVVLLVVAVFSYAAVVEQRGELQVAHSKIMQAQKHAAACESRAQVLLYAFERQKALTLDMVSGVTPDILSEQRSITASVGDDEVNC